MRKQYHIETRTVDLTPVREAVVQQISAAGLARQGVTFASSVVLLIPPLLVFLIAQGNVMETMANSGMKD